LSRCKRVSTNLCLSCAAHRSEAIHAKYGGDKNLVLVEGDHNSPRPRFLYDSIGIFLTQTLQVSARYTFVQYATSCESATHNSVMLELF
jgi:hypothetical protein